MATLKKIGAIALTALTIAVATAPSAEARWRSRGGVVAAGLIGGALLGAAFAGASYARPVYAAPVYEPECFRRVVGHTYYGRPIVRTVCR